MEDVRTSEKQQPAEITRRSFYVGVIYGVWGIIAAALGLPALAYLFLPPKARQESNWVEIGDTATLETNVPMALTFRRKTVDGWKIQSEKSTAWVVKQADNQIVAFGPQCTHLGCAYHWEERENEFLCPCHASLFSIDGKVVSGPAPRPLDRYETRIEGTKLLVGDLHHSEPTA